MMFSPNKTTPNSPKIVASKRGLFKDGVWCCNCPERTQAIKLQVKKEGPNHGRWFYTCHQPQHLRCGFFLWASEAEPRERAVLLANSRSELDPLTLTPSKTPRRGGNGLVTPQTERKFIDVPAGTTATPPKSAKARMMSEDTDTYGWNDDTDDDEELTEALSSSQGTWSFISQPNFRPGSPPKSARKPTVSSPSKRKLSDFAYGQSSPAARNQAQIATPLSSRASRSQLPPPSAELCMTPTPSRYSNVLHSDSRSDASDLAKSTLALLDKHNVVLPNRARDELVTLLNRQELRTQGIVRGRDITRIAMKKKDEQIELLNERMQFLETQREMDRTVLDGIQGSASVSASRR